MDSDSYAFDSVSDLTSYSEEKELRDHRRSTFYFEYNAKGTDINSFEDKSDKIGLYVNSPHKLRDSTKKLLALIDEIQSNTNESHLLKPIQLSDSIHQSSSLLTDIQNHCSVYQRLTRQCNCLNHNEYNEFVIHFNEATKYSTSTMGEIVKNIRILKKFVIMGGDYTKRALKFLNEGLSTSSYVEKVNIVQGCSHADVCNVFDEPSIVTICIASPCFDNKHGNATTQTLAAEFLYNLAQLEEGRRYLKFSSKIANDLNKIMRMKASKLNDETFNYIDDTLNILNLSQSNAPHTNETHYCKPVEEGFGSKTIKTMINLREQMTLEEILAHLDMLLNLSSNSNGKHELAAVLPNMLKLFKSLIKAYDDSELNILVTNILNNIVSRDMIKPKISCPKTVIVAETGTDAIKMCDRTNQVPHKPLKAVKNWNLLKQRINAFQNRYEQPSQKVDPYQMIIVPVQKIKME